MATKLLGPSSEAVAHPNLCPRRNAVAPHAARDTGRITTSTGLAVGAADVLCAPDRGADINVISCTDASCVAVVVVCATVANAVSAPCAASIFVGVYPHRGSFDRVNRGIQATTSPCPARTNTHPALSTYWRPLKALGCTSAGVVPATTTSLCELAATAPETTTEPANKRRNARIRRALFVVNWHSFN